MTSPPNAHRVHPWLFMILIIPFGVSSGYVSVTLAYQLKMAGASVAQVAALSAMGILPQTWKFFWAPVVDVTFSQKKWYVLSGILTAITIGAMGFFPPTKAGLAVLFAVVFLSSLMSTVLGMAVESLLAYSTPDELKGRAGGWLQAGNLGGAGIGGGLGLSLVGWLHSDWLASSIVGVLCLLCCVALPGVPSPGRPELAAAGVVAGLKATVKDLWQMVRHHAGAFALLLCFLPLGTTAAPFSAVADEWHASADTVAMVNGTLNGIISAIGCILGGWVCDRMDRKMSYVWFGILQGATAVAMALLPRSSIMFIVWVLVYSFAGGMAYAAYSAFVLEAIGRGAAATKYNVLSSFSNMPIWYMTILDGWAHDKWNSNIMFYTEAGMAVVGAVIFVVLIKIFPGVSRQGKLESNAAACEGDG